jgi:hypothetical protein
MMDNCERNQNREHEATLIELGSRPNSASKRESDARGWLPTAATFAAEQGMSAITENVGTSGPSVGAFSTALPFEDHQPHWFFGMQTDMNKDLSE